MTEDASQTPHQEAILDLPFPAALVSDGCDLLWTNRSWSDLNLDPDITREILTLAQHSLQSAPGTGKQYSNLPRELSGRMIQPIEGVFAARLPQDGNGSKRFYVSLMDMPRLNDSFRHVWDNMADMASEDRLFSMYYWNLYRGADGRPWFFASDFKSEGGFRIECSLDDLPTRFNFVNYPAYRSYMEAMAEAGATGRRSIVAHARTPTGRDRFFETMGQPVLGDERLIASGLAIDVTAKVMARQAQEQAAHMGALRFAMSGVAHEFNNMLTSWTAQLEFLGLEIPQHADASARHEMNRLMADFERGRQVSRALTRIASLASDPYAQVAPEHIALKRKGLCEDSLLRIIESMQILCRNVNFEPLLQLDGFQVRDDVDEERLAGALFNLTLNSMRAIHQRSKKSGPLYRGVIKLKVEMHPGRPGDWFHDDAEPCKHGCLQITVQDNGIGMPPEVCDRCTEPFFTTDADYGHGMGLSETSALVTGVNGAIKVDSTEGKGTKVMIFLPATQPA